VGQGLSNVALLGVLSGPPPSIVVELLVFAQDEVLSIGILVFDISISEFVDERVNKLSQELVILLVNDPFIEFIHDVLTNEHSLNVELHVFQVVGSRVNVLGELGNHLLSYVQVLHIEGVSHCSISKGMLAESHTSDDLTLLE